MKLTEMFLEPREINEYWKVFAAALHLENASEIQRTEMKRAFFAGFDTCLSATCELADQKGEEDAVKQLESWRQQCIGFAVAVQEGAA